MIHTDCECLIRVLVEGFCCIFVDVKEILRCYGDSVRKELITHNPLSAFIEGHVAKWELDAREKA